MVSCYRKIACACFKYMRLKLYFAIVREVDVCGMEEAGLEAVGRGVAVHLEASPEEAVFRPGSIHDASVYGFWKEQLLASEWVLDVLRLGYKIPFVSPPGPYEEPNNASARANMAVVKNIVADMIASGVVKVVTVKPHCVSPLGLVSKELPDGTFKHRLVFDASRWVNGFVADQKVTLPHIAKALDITERGDWQVVFDLKSAFYHVRVHEDHWPYLGAAITNTDGSTTYFVYMHLPFGLKCAVHGITKLWKPVTAYLQRAGLRMSIYIDDGRILAKNEEEAECFRTLAYGVIGQAGWQLESAKSDGPGQAHRTKKYLGFVINTDSMTVSAEDKKLCDIRQLCDVVMKKDPNVHLLAKLLGKIVSLHPSHGMVTRVCTRSAYLVLALHTEKFGWTGVATLSESAKTEIQFFVTMIRECNGASIQSVNTSMRIERLLPNALASNSAVSCFGSQDHHRISSDASGFKAAVINLDSPSREVMTFPFSSAERQLASGLRELLAVEKALLHWAHEGAMARKNVYWVTDSSNVVAFLTKGSPKVHVQRIVFRIVEILAKMGSHVIPVHLYRADERIVEADAHSKIRDTDDWSIDTTSFVELRQRFKLTTDVFANGANARLPRFFSEFFEDGSAGVEAFSQVWGSGLWMCPPISLLVKTAHEIRKRQCEGILILPDWPTATFYGSFFYNNLVRPPFLLMDRIRPFIYQNQGGLGALNGKVTFDMLILYFNNIL